MPQTGNDETKVQVVLLDVYETLLDMSDVERSVNALLDSKRGYMFWFDLFLQYCFLDSCTNQFHPFGAIAKVTMQMAAKRMGRVVRDSDVDAVLERLKFLPVKEGVPEGLSDLNDTGLRIAAITNTPKDILWERMEPTGLTSYFELVLSVEQIRKYKPSPEVYEWVAKKLGVSKNEIVMVSAHDWDLVGAASAGMKTAYLHHDPEWYYPLAPAPDFLCRDLRDVALQLAQYTGENLSR